MMDGHEQRWADVESRLAHQERMIADLSDVIYRQQQAIDRLEAALGAALERMRELALAAAGPGSEPPPPHY
jgi:SlyX protein